jgi:hypothetical protein
MITDLYKQKTSLELSWQQEHNTHGRYTLDMVRIDSKIRQVINEIKHEEAKIATRENAIADSAPQVSVAT